MSVTLVMWLETRFSLIKVQWQIQMLTCLPCVWLGRAYHVINTDLLMGFSPQPCKEGGRGTVHILEMRMIYREQEIENNSLPHHRENHGAVEIIREL